MKKHSTLHLQKEEILRAVEQELLQIWQDGRLAAPTSPLQAAATLAMHTLRCLPSTCLRGSLQIPAQPGSPPLPAPRQHTQAHLTKRTQILPSRRRLCTCADTLRSHRAPALTTSLKSGHKLSSFSPKLGVITRRLSLLH